MVKILSKSFSDEPQTKEKLSFSDFSSSQVLSKFGFRVLGLKPARTGSSNQEVLTHQRPSMSSLSLVEDALHPEKRTFPTFSQSLRCQCAFSSRCYSISCPSTVIHKSYVWQCTNYNYEKHHFCSLAIIVNDSGFDQWTLMCYLNQNHLIP